MRSINETLLIKIIYCIVSAIKREGNTDQFIEILNISRRFRQFGIYPSRDSVCRFGWCKWGPTTETELSAKV